MSEQGAVATGHPSTTAAAVEILKEGGNAADAAVAAALAAGVCEPLLTGLCGGGIATLRDGASGEVHVLNCFSTFPGSSCGLEPRDFLALEVDYGPTTQIFHAGRGSVAVPGMAAGLDRLARRWGSLPLARLAQPAIRLARDGWTATHGTGVVATMLEAITTLTPQSAALFCPDGHPLAAGDRVQSEPLARALEDFAARGSEPFVRGKHARTLCEAFGPPHGSLSPQDLAAFEPKVLPSLAIHYRGAVLHVPPPPCTGGALLAFGLGLLDRLCPPGAPAVERAACLAAVMAATERARQEGFDAGFFEPGSVEALLSPETLDRHSREVAEELARSASLPRPGPPNGRVPGNTTHISVVDAAGNAVAITSSNGETCGHLWPGTDIPVNNFLGEEDIHPLGFHRGSPGDPFRTMMTPALLVEEDGGVLALGTGGSNRIRTAMLQVVQQIVDEGEDIESAILHPRIHVEGQSAQVERIDQDEEWLRSVAGHRRELAIFEGRHLYFGGVHTAGLRADGSFVAVGDPRRSGVGSVA